MKVVILAGSVKEGDEYRRIAGLSRNDVFIPGSARGAEGLDLDGMDLIVEFESFAGHPHAAEIRAAVEHSASKSQPAPLWEKISG